MKTKRTCVILAVLLAVPTVRAQVLTAERLFEADHVVDVKITIAPADWDTIRFQKRAFMESLGKEMPESPFTYVKADVEIDGLKIPGCGIRKKGFLGSLDDNRPSFKIRFDKYNKTQQPIVGIDRLTLNNNKQDPAAISQLLGYRFFNQTGTQASRCNLAKVTVNGKYFGLYSNVESIRPPMLQRAFGDDSGALYEGTVCDFFPDFLQRFELKNKAANSKPLEQITKLLHAEEIDLGALGQLIDLDAFVKYWATESLLGFWDGYTNDQNNYFMYQHPKNRRIYFIPWGADALFMEDMPIPPYQVRPRFVHHKAILPNRLYRLPSMQKKYHEAMERLLAEHWDEAKLLAEIDRLEARLSEYVRSDNKEFKSSLDRYRDFIRNRRGRLQREMKGGPVTLKKGPQPPAYSREVGSGKLTFQAKWFDATPGNAEDIGKVDITMKMDGKPITFQKLGAFAEHSKWPPLPPEVPKPPTVVFSGQLEPKGRRALIAVTLPIPEFKPTGEKSVPVEGVMFIGPIGWPTTEVRMLTGRVNFTAAAMKNEAEVSGELTLKVLEFATDE